MERIKMIAIGNAVKKGDMVTRGTLKGRLEHGEDSDTGRENDILGFITVENGSSYLVAIAGRLLEGWSKLYE